MMEYNQLFEAMWKQAIIDEMEEQVFRLTTDVMEHLYPDATIDLKNKKSQSEDEREVIKIIKSEIIKTSLKKAIQMKIYKESQRWPNNYKGLDQSFERKYSEIKKFLLSHIDTLVLTEYNKIVSTI